jgi:hypothetical protein
VAQSIGARLAEANTGPRNRICHRSRPDRAWAMHRLLEIAPTNLLSNAESSRVRREGAKSNWPG